jgi:hypothetical protein
MLIFFIPLPSTTVSVITFIALRSRRSHQEKKGLYVAFRSLHLIVHVVNVFTRNLCWKIHLMLRSLLSTPRKQCSKLRTQPRNRVCSKTLASKSLTSYEACSCSRTTRLLATLPQNGGACLEHWCLWYRVSHYFYTFFTFNSGGTPAS